MSEKVYDILKALCTVILPAIGALYVGLSSIWNLPYATEIAGTLAAICTFIGAIIGIDSKKYWETKEVVDK